MDRTFTLEHGTFPKKHSSRTVYYGKNLNFPFELTENKVRKALQNIGFGVLTEISIRDAFKSKLDFVF